MKRLFLTLCLALACMGQAMAYVSTITTGYYRLHNYSYTNLTMTDNGGTVYGLENDENSYAQVWQITRSGNSYNYSYTFKNLLTGRYIQSNSDNSVGYTTGSTAARFTATTGTESGQTYFLFSNYLHCAASQSNMVVYWYDNTSVASRWYLEKVTLSSEELAAIQEAQNAVSNAPGYTSTLQNFFSDYACTTLKSNYQSMTDAQLRSAMSSLPSALQDMAVRVKNDTWNSDATWNQYEKDFRIHDYEIYSNCDEWYKITKVGPFARLANPTGIQAKAGDLVYLYVDADATTDATLEVEEVVGTNREGATTTLTRGCNAIYVAADCELFITYLLNNTAKSCNDYPNIKVHIEGATCNGCFDMHRGHTNDDWTWLVGHMFKGTYLHVKGESTLLNLVLSEVKNADDPTAIMKIWDFVFDTEESLAGCDQWKESGRYKMMINNFRNLTDYPYPHWGSGHGTSHPKLDDTYLFNYASLATIGVNGGNLWEITHEIGHGHQGPIKTVGTTEASNNTLSQICNYMTAGNDLFQSVRSSRGLGVAYMVEKFNSGYSWIDIGGQRAGDNDLWASNRWLYQLWMYFDLLKHYKPETNTGFSFMSDLYDAMRADPMTYGTSVTSPGKAENDYLKIAKYAAQVTQTDLSEFFQAWGFWELAPTISNSNDVAASNIWYYNDYTVYYLQTSAEAVNTVRTAMKQYTKKGGNIMFIEDRGVGSALATYNGASTSTFGEVGYYATYDNKVVDPYQYTLSGTKVTMTGGKGAVGFKIYDASGNLVYVANTNSFTVSSDIAAGLKNGTYTLKAAQGDGKDYAMGESYGADSDKPITDFSEVGNTRYYTVRTEVRGWLCAPSGGEHLRSTALAGLEPSEADPQQQFAFVEKNGKNYLYSVGERKFVSDDGPTTALVTPGVHHEVSLLSTGVDDYPTAIQFEGTNDQINISTWGDPGVVTNWDYITDPGNQFAILPGGTYDPAEALSWLPISSTDELSNQRAYTIFCNRGTLGVSDGLLVSTSKSDYTASNFALISYESQFYLWSIEARAFVNAAGDVTNIEPTPITLQDLGGGLFQLRFGSNAVNTSANYTPGLVINSWTTLDDGNQYTIAPVEEFDPTEALTVLGAPVTVDYTYVTDLSQLSNGKRYIVTNARATWNVAADATEMTTRGVVDPTLESEHFALLQSEGRYYIYSINRGKYLTSSNTLSDEPQHVEISATGNADYPWFFKFDDSHNVNVNSAGTISIDTWTTLDVGNSNAIIELDDFDPSEALDRTTVVSQTIEPWFTTNVNAYFGLSQSVCDANKSALEPLLAECSPYDWEEQAVPLRTTVLAGIRYPETGQYRIQSSGSRIGESYIGYGTSPVYGTTGLVTVPASAMEDDPSTVLTLTKVEGQDATYTITTTAGNVQAFTDLTEATYNVAYPVSDDEGVQFLFDVFAPGWVYISTSRGITYFHETGYDPNVPPVVRWDNSGTASQWRVVDVATTIPGDVNRDGLVTLADVTALVNIVAGKDNTQPYTYDHGAADINGDKDINTDDVEALVKVLLAK